MTDDADDTKAFLDSLQMEHRGYEIARLGVDGHWEPVQKYRPNDLSLKQAITDCRRMEWDSRRPGRRPQKYAVRPIVSLSMDFAARAAPPVPIPEDALVTPETLTLNPEESLIVKPKGDEYAGTGFKVTPEQGAVGNVEIPYNYDQLAGSMDTPWEDK